MDVVSLCYMDTTLLCQMCICIFCPVSVILNMRVFGDVTLCHWANSSQHVRGLWFIFRVKQSMKT